MTFVIDNLIAIVVGSVLLGGLIVLQQRNQQSAVEATQRYRAQTLASEMTATLEREVENIRSREETERAFAIVPGGGSVGPDTYRLRLRRDPSDSYTAVFEFPTASNPNSLGDSGTMLVGYRVVPTGETIQIDGAVRPLYSATRYEYRRGVPVVEIGVYDRLLDFDVTALHDGGQTLDAEVVDPAPPRVHVAMRFAPDLPAARAADQGQGSLHSIRYARSIRIPGATAPPGTTPVYLDKPGGLPDFPTPSPD